MNHLIQPITISDEQASKYNKRFPTNPYGAILLVFFIIALFTIFFLLGSVTLFASPITFFGLLVLVILYYAKFGTKSDAKKLEIFDLNASKSDLSIPFALEQGERILAAFPCLPSVQVGGLNPTFRRVNGILPYPQNSLVLTNSRVIFLTADVGGSIEDYIKSPAQSTQYAFSYDAIKNKLSKLTKDLNQGKSINTFLSDYYINRQEIANIENKLEDVIPKYALSFTLSNGQKYSALFRKKEDVKQLFGQITDDKNG